MHSNQQHTAQRQPRSTASYRALMLAASMFGLTSCDQSAVAPSDIDHLSAHMNGVNGGKSGAATSYSAHGDLFKAVRTSTARYHSTTQATRAGYESDPNCVSNPMLGGMGYHWVRRPSIDPTFDPLQPEALLYEPGPNGTRTLVGMEYIVLNVGQPAPTFGGRAFDVGGVPPLMMAGIPHWSLHVWLYRDNPAGTFTPFNPTVSCAYASAG